MSTATATQNDDLIILSDNISSSFGSEPVISQDLNFSDNNSVISFDPQKVEGNENNDFIVLGETNLKQEDNKVIDTPIIKQESIVNAEPITENVALDAKQETKELDSSINNLFGDMNFSDTKELNETNTSISSEEIKDNLVEENIDLFQNNDEQKIDESIGDMNSILNNTIDKLKKRQAGIAGQKSQKTTTIDDLEAKIKDLREKVAYLKKEIVFLDDENIKIDINIGNLESMKTGKTIKTPSKTREHNTKKLTKQIKSV